MAVAAIDRPSARLADPVAQLLEVERVQRFLHEEIVTALHTQRCFLSADQGLMLARLGTEEVTVGELWSKGIYLGTTPSHNLNKMAESGYLARRNNPADCRSHFVKATPRGREIAALVRTTVAKSQHLSRVRIIP